MSDVFNLILDQMGAIYNWLHSTMITWHTGALSFSVSYWALLVSYLTVQVIIDLVFFFVNFTVYVDFDSDD